MADTALTLTPETPVESASGLLDVGALVRMFEESEDSTYESRKLAERDRDYYDGKQLTAEEIATLRKRGQPEVIINRIKRKIDYLVGLEKQQRIDPKALPRTPVHEQDADGATQGLRYVAEYEDFDNKRSGVWRNMLIEGAGGIGVAVQQAVDYGGRPGIDVKLRRYAWDRIFWDPHSAEADFSDAGYIGTVVWMDYDDALAMYPDGKEALDVTLQSAPSDTYDDKPKWNHWADKQRKRVRICQIWIKRADQWHFAEFTKGGILKGGPSPYQTDKGESDCELFFQSAYVDRDNNRYGVVREMVSPQDEINKRRSKALHLLSTAQVWIEEDAIPGETYGGVDGLKKNAARPDGVNVLPPGALSNNKVKIETRTDLATAQFQLLQENKNEIDLMGPNATMLGDKTQGSSAASGKAIIASQQGGMIEMGDLLDNLRHLDKRVFRAIWNRIRQFWTEEKWIRVTDDERNVKWVGMNIAPEQMQQMQMAMQQNPEAAEKIAGMVTSIAELDCDIIIDEAPDSVTPALEQWQALTELAKGGVPIPPDVLIEAAPNLKNKDKILDRMQEPNPGAQAQQELAMRGAAAEVAETEESANLKRAQAQKTLIEARLAPAEFQQSAANEQANREERFAMKGADMQERGRDREARSDSERMRAQQKAAQPANGKPVSGKPGAAPAPAGPNDGLQAAITSLVAEMRRPKRVVRDESGRVVGIAPAPQQQLALPLPG